MPLSRIQLRVIEVVKNTEGAHHFVLAGGGALIALCLVQRDTADLDFFTSQSTEVNRFAHAVMAQLELAALTTSVLSESVGFVRMEVSDQSERTEVDFAWDSMPDERTEVNGMSTLVAEQLAVNKLLALFGRAERRDLFDVFELCQSFDRDELLRSATEKDMGFSAEAFVTSLRALARFDFDDTMYGKRRWRRMLAWAQDWADELDGER